LQIPCKEIPSENVLRVNLPSFCTFFKKLCKFVSRQKWQAHT
jgi:hypothetical protein